jgi:hypothetical protein
MAVAFVDDFAHRRRLLLWGDTPVSVMLSPKAVSFSVTNF